MEVQGTSIMEHANFSQQQVTLNISLLPAVKHTVYLKEKKHYFMYCAKNV